MRFRENPASATVWLGPPTPPSPSDIREKQLPLDIPSLLQSLGLPSSLWRLSSITAEGRWVEGAA